MTEIDAYTLSPRVQIHPGDVVHLGPSKPHKRDAFNATAHRLLQDDDGGTYIEVYHRGWRTLPVERVQRKVKT